MEKVLTISVAAYNAEKDLVRCLDSMVHTVVASKLDVIVVNDGSKDNTLQVARKYEDKYPNIVRVIDKENGGHGSTINASIKVATGKYYKIVDSDDWVDKEGIERLVHELECIDADLVLNPYHDINAETLQTNNLIRPYTSEVELGKVGSVEGVKGIVIYMHSTTFKTSVVKEMGPVIDEHCYYVDMEYTLFPLQFVKSYICFDFPVYQYLMGTATQSMNRNSLINRRDQHLKVTKRVIDYYETNREGMSPGISEMILRRVRLALLNQYKIYFSMSERTAKKEVISFDRWVKEKSNPVYEGPEGRLMKIVKFNRKTRYIFISLIVNILKLIHMEPEL